MFKRLLFLLLISLLLPVMPTTQAQDSPAAWRIILLDSTTGAVSTLTPGGLEPGPTFPEIMKMYWISNPALSPDGRYLVFTDTTQANNDVGMESYLYIADLVEETCCRKLEDPIHPEMDVFGQGPFSPDGTQIVVSMTNSATVYTSDSAESLVAVFDVASGNVVVSMLVAHLEAEYPGMAAVFGKWDQDGIRLAPTCIDCEGVWEGMYQIWDPTTDTLYPPSEYFDVLMQELPATGEQLRATENRTYPTSGAATFFHPPSNVVEVHVQQEESPGQVVFFDPAHLYLHSANWVYDGNGILVFAVAALEQDPESGRVSSSNESAHILLLRDGRQVSIPTESGWMFAATPDGWLTRDHNTKTILHNVVTATGEISSTTLATGAGDHVIGTNFVLGATVTGPFPTAPLPEPVTCPGFMPSRLWPNSAARVTSGPANNLRAEPSTTSAEIGQIPGEEAFIVLAGPTCAEDMAWWQVSYKGQVGWTVEGQGSAYWLEPMPSMY